MEDETRAREFLVKGLTESGFVVDAVADGDEGLHLVEEREYDLIVLDAFSSDSVPAHLMTVEALDSYMSRLKPDGMIAITRNVG